MTREALAAYLELVVRRHQLPFYIERAFRTDEEWDKDSGFGFRYGSLAGRGDANIRRVLEHSAAVVLGDPGSGKSTVAQAAVRTVVDSGSVPLFASLRSYRGDLTVLLRGEAPEELLNQPQVDGVPVAKTIILDGLDELAAEQFDAFLADFAALRREPQTKILLTSRQAFFAANRHRFGEALDAFHLLGLRSRDVRAYVGHLGGRYEPFISEVERVGLVDEVSNPFALRVLHRAFTDAQRLDPLPHQAVDRVVESLIESRPAVSADRQRRALQMLAVAMETANRNELTTDEAIQVLQATTTATADDARTVLDELTMSILITTTNGIAFQMRSYGEYVAAKELAGLALDKVMSLVTYQGTLIPNESWRNCVSYLAAMNQEVRRHFMVRFPDWVAWVSPNALTESERATLIRLVLRRLTEAGHYLVRHPSLPVSKVARHVVEAVRAELAVWAIDPYLVTAGNAMAVLGFDKCSAIVPIAMPVVITPTSPRLFRESAILAVIGAGDASLIPTLMAHLNAADPLHLELVDCIGALADAHAIPTVLPLLARTDGFANAAFYHFRDLGSGAGVDALLATLLAEPGLMSSSRLGSYAEPLWEAIVDHWDTRWCQPLASLLVAFEEADVFPNDLEDVHDVLRRLPLNSREEIARRTLAGFIAKGIRPLHVVRIMAELITPSVIEWLVLQGAVVPVMQAIAGYCSREVRAALAPHLGGLIEAQDQHAVVFREQQERHAEQERRAIDGKRESILTSLEMGRVLGAMATLKPTDWPPLPDDRGIWLTQEVNRALAGLNLPASIRWDGDHQVWYSQWLPQLVHAITHYDLEVSDDRLLVYSIIGVSDRTSDYVSRRGLSPGAIRELERLLADPATANGALYNVLSVLDGTTIRTPALASALIAIAADNNRQLSTRSRALRIGATRGATEAQLTGIGQLVADPSLQEEALNLLVKQQHLPTIGRRLADLRANPILLAAGEVAFPNESSLGWLTDIRTGHFWSDLRDLRQLALQSALPQVTTLITSAMKAIDELQLLAVIEAQMPFAPPDWQEAQRIHLLREQRETRLTRAQATPFADVLQRIRRATTAGLLRVWCEGPTDVSTIEKLFRKLPDATGKDVDFASLGGWGAISSPQWRAESLLAGCRDTLVLLDGDNGRDYAVHGHPLSARSASVRHRLAEAGIDVVVLRGYGIENYFTRAAVEVAHGPALAAQFPLADDGRPVGIPKNRNHLVADQMTLADLAGSDLLTFLESVSARSL
jgi:hypothetical protein